MRRFIPVASFFALLAALCLLWVHRFERVPGLATWQLADLRTAAPPVQGLLWSEDAARTKLQLRTTEGGPPVAARLAIPGAPAVPGLHLRFRMSARGLVPGARNWEDGRFLIEWHPASGAGPVANELVGSIRSDERGGLIELVILAEGEDVMPSVRLENLGSSGEFELADLEITAVRERMLWKSGKWLLAGAWLGWFAACIRLRPGIAWWRALLAAAICVLMGIHFVVPGPWKPQRPLHQGFQLGEVSPARAAPPADPPPSLQPGALPSLGKLPDQGSLILQIKVHAASIRPLLHALLLFGPALALAFLLGRKPALLLMSGMALAIESAQMAFGYGFDLVDVFDLACDAAGIGLALWLVAKVPAKWRAPSARQKKECLGTP
jgi:hypothetical protein